MQKQRLNGNEIEKKIEQANYFLFSFTFVHLVGTESVSSIKY